EDCGGAAALRGWKPRCHNAAIAGKYGRLRQPGAEPQREDGSECPGRGRIAGEPNQKRAHRPGDDADAVNTLRAEAVQQSARGELPADIRPAKAGEQQPHLRSAQAQRLLHGDAAHGERYPVAIARGAGDEQHRDDEVTDVRLALRRRRRVARFHERPAINLLSISASFASRSISGVRTGPAGRPMTRIPAFTMETA